MSSNVDVWSSRAVTLDCLFTLEDWKQTSVKQITEVEALFGRVHIVSLQCFDFCEDRMLCNEVRHHNIIISSNNRVETTSHEPCTGVCVPDIDFTPTHNCESRSMVKRSAN